MISSKDTMASTFIDQLKTQKSFYEQILVLSGRETAIIKSKPFSMAQVLEVLQAKNKLVNNIQELEQQLADQRVQIDFTLLNDTVKQEISELIQCIGTLLRKLLAQDAENEELLRECINSGKKPAVNTNYAMRAYGAYAK